jgi:hypothetical protein
MHSIFPYVIPMFTIAALGALVLSRRRPPLIEDNSGHCSSCETPMSPRRVPLAKSHALLGEWECPHCRTHMNKGGVPMSPAGPP